MDGQPCNSGSDLNNDLYHTLEFDKVLDDLSSRAQSALAATRLKALRPLSGPERVRKSLERISELCTLMESGGVFPLSRFEDITGHLDIAGVEGSYLPPEAFRHIHENLSVARKLHRFFSENRPRFPLLQEMGQDLTPNPELETEMNRCIDLKTLDIRDQASRELATIRRTLARAREDIRRDLETLLDRLWRGGVLQERLITMRQGRWVLPVKETHRYRVKGALHDQSASGATLFIEPLEILERNNRVRRLESEERHEIEKILRRLTGLIRENREELEQNLEVLVSLDCVYAMALTAKALNQHAPAIDSHGLLEIRQGRHPLLMLQESRQSSVTPLDLSIGGDFTTLVITGPNAGGKTVALKTVGLLSLMFSCGLFVPATPDSHVPVFNRIYAHIGDAQSIEKHLSTFSAHVKGISHIINEAAPGDLVLIDEIGSGTDPHEGAALSMAVLEALTQRGVLTIVTTHQGALKIFAHQAPGIANGSMAFDSRMLTPTYRFVLHLPGSSYALEIAHRMGLDDDIVERSRALMGHQAHRLEDLISELQGQIETNEQLEEDLQEEKSVLETLTRRFREENERLKQDAGTLRREAAEEASAIVKRANATVEKAIQTIREKKASRQGIREARALIKEEREELVRELEGFSPHGEYAQPDQMVDGVESGDRVYWKRGEVVATVVSGEDTAGNVMVVSGNLKFRVPKKELAKTLRNDKLTPGSSATVAYPFPKNVRSEIDIRGMKVEEALEAVDKLVNDALLAGLSQVEIVHGLGTGALRNSVIPFLNQHPLVAKVFSGGSRQENRGVTIARIGGE
jgi:DNA mismatch repair protein MutS2